MRTISWSGARTAKRVTVMKDPAMLKGASPQADQCIGLYQSGNSLSRVTFGGQSTEPTPPSERMRPLGPEVNIIIKKHDILVVLFHILRVKYGIKIPNMSCHLFTTLDSGVARRGETPPPTDVQ